MDRSSNAKLFDFLKSHWWQILSIVVAGTATYVKLEARISTSEHEIEGLKVESTECHDFRVKQQEINQNIVKNLDSLNWKIDKLLRK